MGGDRRLPDLRQFQQHRFDFARFDAVAANLDLGIDAAVIFDLAVGVDAAEVAGAVDALGRVVGDAEEVGNELLRRQFVAVPIAGRKPDAGNADLTELARLNRPLLVRIENDDRVGRQGPADGDRLARRQFRQAGGDGGFGRAVGVEDGPARAMPTAHQILRAGLAADQQDPELRQFFFDGREQRRTTGKTRDLARAQERAQFVADQADALPAGNERGARHQRHPDFLDREIKGNGHALIDAVAGRIAVKLGGDAHEIADARVLDDDTLRVTGRARGVDDVADLIDRRRDLALAERRARFAIDCRLGGVDQDVAQVERGQLFLEGRGRHDGAEARVLGNEADALDRKPRVERHIGRVDLQDRQQRNIGLDRPIEQQADAIAGLDTTAQQMARKLVGAGFELLVAERHVVGKDGHVACELGTALFDEVIEPLAVAPTNGFVARWRRLSNRNRLSRHNSHAANVGTRIWRMPPVGYRKAAGRDQFKSVGQDFALLLDPLSRDRRSGRSKTATLGCRWATRDRPPKSRPDLEVAP